MALIVCKKCGKNISDQANSCVHCGEIIEKVDITCPECNNKLQLNVDKCTNCGYIFKKTLKLNRKNLSKPNATKKQVSIKLVLLTIQLLSGIYALFNFFNFNYGETSFIVFFLPVFLLLINTILIIINLMKKTGRTFLNIIEIFSIICAVIVIMIVGYNGKVYYIDYENNYDIMILSDIYSKNTAKKLINQMNEIFDYENITGEKSNWRLSSFYHFEDDNYMLYIEDFNTNSYHGFTVNLDNEGMIKNMFWGFNDSINLYLYKNGEKTENFYYYYVMNEYDTLLVNYEYDIGLKLDTKLDMSPNAEIEYANNIYYDATKNIFIKYGTVKDINETNFNIIFKKSDRLEGFSSLYEIIDWSVKFN